MLLPNPLAISLSKSRVSQRIVLGGVAFLAFLVCVNIPKSEDVWIESRRGIYSSEIDYFFSGPFIHRKTDHPGFAFQSSTCSPLKIKDLIPFCLVFDCKDSMTTLSDFDLIVSDPWHVSTHGRIRFSTDQIIEMEYVLEVESWNVGSKYKETITFSIDDKEIEFDLENGRVFHTFAQVANSGLSKLRVEQKSIDLPTKKELLRSRSDLEKYDVLYDWWQKHRSEKR